MDVVAEPICGLFCYFRFLSNIIRNSSFLSTDVSIDSIDSAKIFHFFSFFAWSPQKTFSRPAMDHLELIFNALRNYGEIIAVHPFARSANVRLWRSSRDVKWVPFHQPELSYSVRQPKSVRNYSNSSQRWSTRFICILWPLHLSFDSCKSTTAQRTQITTE